MFSVAQEQERMKVVQPEPIYFHLAPFITGLEPFEKMALAVTTAEHFRRSHGRGGARMTIFPLSLSWIRENDKVGRKNLAI